MQKREVNIRAQISRQKLEKLIGKWAKSQDAEVRPMSTLTRRYKTEQEAMHWHVSGLEKGKGTVEVTYVPSTGVLAVVVHDNRRGSWAGHAYQSLASELASLA